MKYQQIFSTVCVGKLICRCNNVLHVLLWLFLALLLVICTYESACRSSAFEGLSPLLTSSPFAQRSSGCVFSIQRKTWNVKTRPLCLELEAKHYPWSLCVDIHIKGKEKVAQALIAYALTYRMVGTTQIKGLKKLDAYALHAALWLDGSFCMKSWEMQQTSYLLQSFTKCLGMWNVITAGCFLGAIKLKWLTQGHSIPVPPNHWFAFITDKTLNAAYWDTSILMMPL